ncbi:precorrin-6A reductase [Vibrio tritonius]|uniref:Precorrin-6A reductase n=1 Tax=Vibrio tritonius TaxID=1435069 RepID=A0ABS7YSC8_9VIBR|nr:precorrin-6A reductase [Vibrio tritonius]MCA2017139.1 precorrin-6A reductase [Vibrio tritonius]
MSSPKLLVFGGTSDSIAVCRELEQLGIHYTFSVATDAGRQMAQGSDGKPCIQGELIVGRMDVAQMQQWMTDHHITHVIDAAHPYAQELRQNIMTASIGLNLPLVRFERQSQHIDHELITRVESVQQACEEIKSQGWQKVLLTTGSKDLGTFCQQLPEQNLIARVLPTAEVMQQCEALGLGVDNLIAMKGPFSEALNHALYQTVAPDVMVTKESGQAGGFLEKMRPCLELGIACVVIERPQPVLSGEYHAVLSELSACQSLFTQWIGTQEHE